MITEKLEKILKNSECLVDEYGTNQELNKELEKNNVYILVGDAISKNDKAVLFTGDPMVGKSTISNKLLNQGFEQLSEDVTIATIESDEIYLNKAKGYYTDELNLTSAINKTTKRTPLRAIIELKNKNAESIVFSKNSHEAFKNSSLSSYTKQITALNKVATVKYYIDDTEPENETYSKLKKSLINLKII